MRTKTALKTFISSLLFVIIILLLVFYFFGNSFKTNNAFINSDDYVEFFDVGQGDCTLLSSNGKYCLVDTGTEESSEELLLKLKKQGIRDIDMVSVSHFHADHTGGLYDTVSKFNVDNLLFPTILTDTDLSKKVDYARRECLAEDGELYYAKPGMTVTVGDFKITVLYYNGQLKGENNRSVYMMAKIGEIKFLFTGDGESQAENGLLNSGLNIDCDVLKVPHHGGSGSSTEKFLDACTPEYSVISCGKGNSYGHPHKEALSRYKKRNIKTYRTDKNGDVVFAVNGEQVTVSTEK